MPRPFFFAGEEKNGLVQSVNQRINSVMDKTSENLWHWRYGHLGERNLSKLKKDGIVNGFDYDTSKKMDFCESCITRKIHRCPFPRSCQARAEEPLGLIHSDVCEKISSPSLSRAEYFVLSGGYLRCFLVARKPPFSLEGGGAEPLNIASTQRTARIYARGWRRRKPAVFYRACACISLIN